MVVLVWAGWLALACLVGWMVFSVRTSVVTGFERSMGTVAGSVVLGLLVGGFAVFAAIAVPWRTALFAASIVLVCAWFGWRWPVRSPRAGRAVSPQRRDQP